MRGGAIAQRVLGRAVVVPQVAHSSVCGASIVTLKVLPRQRRSRQTTHPGPVTAGRTRIVANPSCSGGDRELSRERDCSRCVWLDIAAT